MAGSVYIPVFWRPMLNDFHLQHYNPQTGSWSSLASTAIRTECFWPPARGQVEDILQAGSSEPQEVRNRTCMLKKLFNAWAEPDLVTQLKPPGALWFSGASVCPGVFWRQKALIQGIKLCYEPYYYFHSCVINNKFDKSSSTLHLQSMLIHLLHLCRFLRDRYAVSDTNTYRLL